MTAQQQPNGREKQNANKASRTGSAKDRRMNKLLHKVSRNAIRRLAYRASVKHITKSVHKKAPLVLRTFLETAIVGAVARAEQANRKTVTAEDVAHSLKNMGKEVSGVRS